MINYKRYAGITSQRIKTRFIQHCTQGYGLTTAINKYGRENFNVEIIASSNNLDVIKNYEIRYIKSLNLTDREFGYNLSDGGNLTAKTESTKRKISKKMKGSPKSKEHRAKIKANAIKRGKELKGKPRKSFSKEWKRNIGLSKKGLVLTDDHKNAISAGLRSSEKAKLADKGKYFRTNNPQNNPELRSKIARSKFKPIYCINNGLCYLSLKLAAEGLGLIRGSVSNALTKGNRIHGYKFYYIYK